MGFGDTRWQNRASSSRFAGSRSLNLGPLQNYQTVSLGSWSPCGVTSEWLAICWGSTPGLFGVVTP
jgi:hypothetical protein